MRNRLMLVAALVLFTVPVVSADTLDVVRGGTGFHAFETPSTSGGTAFWNRSSYDDNHACNIGYWLSGSGGCGANLGTFYTGTPRMTPSYLGDETTGFNVVKAPTTASVTVTTRMQVTDYKDLNEFGWYDAAKPSVLTPLFQGVGMLNSSQTFVPSGTYGFYLKSPEGIYLSNGTGDTRTHFAVFQLPGNGHYLMGTEDMWTRGDWDFNDVIFEIQANSLETPEPASMVLLGTGLLGLGAAVRRRQRAARA